MQTVTESEAKQNFSALIRETGKGAIGIARDDDRKDELAFVVSPEDYWKLHRLKVHELMKLCDEMGREAQARGLTEEILAEILAE